ncbi:MAG: transposase [Candidatus Omnitrophica bacterium]|nr:transposase [Candidatus Omnitrophota bacterium]
MSRTRRIIFEGHPHHVIQRGNRRQRVFFKDEDKKHYLDLLKKKCDKYSVLVWAYCLMDNHVHLVLVPSTSDGLAKAVGQTHWRYALQVNKRMKWRGHLWQERFSSFILHDKYLRSVMRYVEMNPVRAGIVAKAEAYKWSSAAAHVRNKVNPILSSFSMLENIKDWRLYLEGEDEKELVLMHRHLSSGRPLGEVDFLKQLCQELKADIFPKKRGPKPKLRIK